jgi:hypothetical protein
MLRSMDVITGVRTLDRMLSSITTGRRSAPTNTSMVTAASGSARWKRRPALEDDKEDYSTQTWAE